VVKSFAREWLQRVVILSAELLDEVASVPGMAMSMPQFALDDLSDIAALSIVEDDRAAEDSQDLSYEEVLADFAVKYHLSASLSPEGTSATIKCGIRNDETDPYHAITYFPSEMKTMISAVTSLASDLVNHPQPKWLAGGNRGRYVERYSCEDNSWY